MGGFSGKNGAVWRKKPAAFAVSNRNYRFSSE